MKLYTYCNANESAIKINGVGVKLENYSYSDYQKFLNIAKNYVVRRIYSWYETDMSDSDSGSITDYIAITYANMVIKNNELYGVIVKTRGYTPKYHIVEFKTKHSKGAYGGGYSENDYDWFIVDNKISNLAVLNYALIVEEIFYVHDEIGNYKREVFGFLDDDAIILDGEVIGFKNPLDVKREFVLADESTHFVETGDKTGNYRTIKKYRLVNLTQNYLENAIFEVTNNDFKTGKYKLL